MSQKKIEEGDVPKCSALFMLAGREKRSKVHQQGNM